CKECLQGRRLILCGDAWIEPDGLRRHASGETRRVCHPETQLLSFTLSFRAPALSGGQTCVFCSDFICFARKQSTMRPIVHAAQSAEMEQVPPGKLQLHFEIYGYFISNSF